MSIIGAVNLFILLGFITGVYLVIKNGLYAELILFVAGLGGLTCGITGFIRIFDHLEKNDLAGTILIGIGITTFLALGVFIKTLLKKDSKYSEPAI